MPALSSDLTLASLATTVVAASGDASCGAGAKDRPFAKHFQKMQPITRLRHLKCAVAQKIDIMVDKVEKSEVLSRVGDKTEGIMKKAADDMRRIGRTPTPEEPVVVDPTSDGIKAALAQKTRHDPESPLFLAYPKFYKPTTTIRKVESDPERPWLSSPTEAHVSWQPVNLTPDTELCMVYFLFHAVDDDLNSIPGIPDRYHSLDESLLEEMTRNMFLVRSEKDLSYPEDLDLRPFVAQNPPATVNFDGSPKKRRRRRRNRCRNVKIEDLRPRVEHVDPIDKHASPTPPGPEDSGTTGVGAPAPTEPVTLDSSSDGQSPVLPSEPAWLTEYCALATPSDPSVEPDWLVDLWKDLSSPAPSDDVSSLALTYDTKPIRPSASVCHLRDSLLEIVEGRKPVVIPQSSGASTPSPEMVRLSAASEVDFYSKYVNYTDQSKDFDSSETPSPEKSSPGSPLASVTFRWPPAGPSRHSAPAVFYQPVSTSDRPVSLRYKVRPMEAPSMALTSAVWVHNAAHRRFGPQPVLSMWQRVTQRVTRVAKKAWTSVKNFLLCRQGVSDEHEISSPSQFL